MIDELDIIRDLLTYYPIRYDSCVLVKLPKQTFREETQCCGHGDYRPIYYLRKEALVNLDLKDTILLYYLVKER